MEVDLVSKFIPFILGSTTLVPLQLWLWLCTNFIKIKALQFFQIAIRGSFSETLKNVHTKDTLALIQTSVWWPRFFSVITNFCFGRVVSVIKVIRPKTENALLGHFRPKIFGGRKFGASLILMHTFHKSWTSFSHNIFSYFCENWILSFLTNDQCFYQIRQTNKNGCFGNDIVRIKHWSFLFKLSSIGDGTEKGIPP